MASKSNNRPIVGSSEITDGRKARCICLFCGTSSMMMLPFITGDMAEAVARANHASADGFVMCPKCIRPGGMMNVADYGGNFNFKCVNIIMLAWHDNGMKAGDWEWPDRAGGEFNVHQHKVGNLDASTKIGSNRK